MSKENKGSSVPLPLRVVGLVALVYACAWVLDNYTRPSDDIKARREHAMKTAAVAIAATDAKHWRE